MQQPRSGASRKGPIVWLLSLISNPCLSSGRPSTRLSELENRNSIMANANLTVVSTEEPPERPSITQVRRPARALVGWMRPEAAQAVLLAGSTEPAAEAAAATAERARRAVAARPEGIDQDGLVRPAPELAGHIRELQASQAAQPYHAEGWRVALVDLARVVACQPFAVSDQATNRVNAIDPEDPASVAALTLPTTQGEPVTARFDPLQRAWIVVSANGNLRIVGPAGPPLHPGGETQVPPAGTLLGFGVLSGVSFMQVACLRGRHFLRDGYHRALGLLDRGITIVPAFVRDITAFEEMFPDPRTLLPQDAYLGSRPPVLPDMLDDTVSASVQVPAVQTMIVISGMQFPLAG
jgi:hypothetical protein